MNGRVLGSSPALESHPACAPSGSAVRGYERVVSRRLVMQVSVTQVQEHREQWLLVVSRQVPVMAVPPMAVAVQEAMVQLLVQVAIGQVTESVVLEQRAMALQPAAAVD